MLGTIGATRFKTTTLRDLHDVALARREAGQPVLIDTEGIDPFAPAQARALAEQLLACAGEASAALGYRGATEAPATPTIRRRQP